LSLRQGAQGALDIDVVFLEDNVNARWDGDWHFCYTRHFSFS